MRNHIAPIPQTDIRVSENWDQGIGPNSRLLVVGCRIRYTEFEEALTNHPGRFETSNKKPHIKYVSCPEGPCINVVYPNNALFSTLKRTLPGILSGADVRLGHENPLTNRPSRQIRGQCRVFVLPSAL